MGDWDVSASGVLRDAEEYIESTTGTTISGRGVPMIAEITATYRGTGTGQPVDLAFDLIGGLDQDRYKTFDVSCGAIPAPAYDVGEPANGESVAFNVCWQVDAAETERAFVEVDQFGVGVDAEPVQLLLPEREGLPGAVADARIGPVPDRRGPHEETRRVRLAVDPRRPLLRHHGINAYAAMMR